MAKKSETLAQREKAQRDLIELKKMQAGEIEVGPKPSEEAKTPQTAKQKIGNFFYHNKIAIIIGSFLAVVLIIIVVDMFQRPSYDSKVVVFSYDDTYTSYNQQIADYFEQYYPDVNGDGKVEIANLDCSHDPEDLGQAKNNALARLNSVLAAEKDALLFLMDEESIKHFDNLDENIFNIEEAVMLPDSFYEYIQTEGLVMPEKKLFVVMRRVEGTLIEGNNADAVEAARAVLEALRAEAGNG